jgi:hypothetical protein
MPAPAPVAVQPTAVPATPQAQPEAPAPASSRKWILIAVIIAVLGILAFIGMRLTSGGDGIEVVSLGPGERLYIGGLRVEGAPRIEKSGALIVSTAVEGKLRRFGRTERRDRIDVRTIPEALPQPGSTGTLKVSEPAGCRVKVGETMLEQSTPLTTSIDAGRELTVLITCPGQPMRSLGVMAVPNQEVEVLAAPRP